MEFSNVSYNPHLSVYNSKHPIYFKSLRGIEIWGKYDVFHAFVAKQFHNIAMDLPNTTRDQSIKSCLDELEKREVKNLEALMDYLINCREKLVGNKLRYGKRYLKEITMAVEERLQYWCSGKFDSHILYDNEYGTIVFQLEKKKPLTNSERLLIKSCLDDSEAQSVYTLVKKFFNISIQFLSEGEQAYIQLFGVLNEVIKEAVLKEVPSLLLLLDEPDQALHPELARQFIFLLEQFIQSRLSVEKHKLKIQLIITTHSPFIVTDFASEQVLYLERKEKETIIRPPTNQTFATNIHHLLIDDFFMQQTIGEFARQKLDEILKLMKAINDENYQLKSDIKKEKEYIKNTIRMIGDPFVKNILKKKFERTFYPKKPKIDQEIEELEERIKYLRKIKEERM